MNKRKRVAMLKHRRTYQKALEKRRSLAAATGGAKK